MKQGKTNFYRCVHIWLTTKAFKFSNNCRTRTLSQNSSLDKERDREKDRTDLLVQINTIQPSAFRVPSLLLFFFFYNICTINVVYVHDALSVGQSWQHFSDRRVE